MRDQEENIKKSAEWKKNNRDKVNESARNCYYKDILATRDKEATRKKGINVERYYELVRLQDNKCAICNLEEKRKNKNGEPSLKLSIDHCHETNVVRGLLCHECNTGLGKFKDNTELLQTAIEHLNRHKE